mmetsp:Transcript_20658/g.29884  ORF Transcript_20658/g.29884 Transcript_20658/m.29884 type:complete len:133 (-) Transcript_20658:95-493(-)
MFKSISTISHQRLGKLTYNGTIFRFLAVKSLTTPEGYNTLKNQDGKSVLYFTAAWCAPCKAIKPVFEDLSKEFEGKVDFGRIDVDECPEVAASAKIRSVPTFFFYMGGKQMRTFSGADVQLLKQSLEDLSEK